MTVVSELLCVRTCARVSVVYCTYPNQVSCVFLLDFFYEVCLEHDIHYDCSSLWVLRCGCYTLDYFVILYFIGLHGPCYLLTGLR